MHVPSIKWLILAFFFSNFFFSSRSLFYVIFFLPHITFFLSVSVYSFCLLFLLIVLLLFFLFLFPFLLSLLFLLLPSPFFPPLSPPPSLFSFIIFLKSSPHQPLNSFLFPLYFVFFSYVFLSLCLAHTP